VSPARDPWFGRHRVMAVDPIFFRDCNRRYRLCYERIADALVERLGDDISGLSFLEIGCNSGLNLFNLARRGAGSCLGVDWGHYRAAFAWLNEALGTKVRFRRGDYDNLRHRVPDRRIDDADVIVNTVFLNHQCDPLQFLCFIADRARRALFLWVLLDERGDEMTLTFGNVGGLHDIGGHRPFPLSFQNDIKISRALLIETLRRLGFGKIEEIAQPTEDPALAPPASLLPFTMIFARPHRRPAERLPHAVVHPAEAAGRHAAGSASTAPRGSNRAAAYRQPYIVHFPARHKCTSLRLTLL
jgi:SAM-dependent methyltransferase